MRDIDKTKKQLINELVEMRQKIARLKASQAERKRAEEELQSSKEFIQTVMNSLADSICIVDAHDFKIIGTNRAFWKTLKMEEKEVIGKTCYEVTHQLSGPCGPPGRICPLSETVKTGRPSSAVHVHWNKGRNKIFVETSTNPIVNEKGEVYQVVHVTRNITQRKKTEEELRKLSRAVEQSPASVVITDAEGTIEYVNPRFAQLTGYTAAEAIGQNPRILKSGKQSPEFYEELWETITHGEEWRGEFYNKKKNGDFYWEFASISPIRNDDGVVTHFIGVKEDISERKRAEEALQKVHEELERKVEERTAELVKANEQLRYEVDERRRADEALRRVNRTLKTLSSCSQALVRAKGESELIRDICRIIVEIGGYRLAWAGLAEQDEEKSVRPVGQWGYEEGYLATVNITWADTERGRGPTGTAIRTGSPNVAQHILTNPDFGPWRAEALKRGYASSIALPLLAGKKCFGALNIYAAEPDAFDSDEVHLLTELAENLSYGIMALRSRAEQKRAEQELRKSEKKYSTLVESSLTGIYIEQEGKIVFANDRFCQIYGYSKDELMGMEAWRLVHPEDRPMIEEITAKRLRGAKAPSEYEVRGLARNGATIWIARINTLMEYGGRNAVLGNIVDITNRKEMENALRESEKQLRYLSSQLLSAQENERKSVAQELHDSIGQTLAAIKFGTEKALEQLPKRASKKIRQPLEAVISMVQNGIQDVRKIQTDLRPSILDDLGILATVSWFCREFQTIYSGIHIKQQIDIQEDDVPDALKTIIYRVLQEALNNIAKHSGANLVYLSLRKSNGTIELTVEDNGLGFDIEDVLSVESSKRGIGLDSMRERTELSAGTFFVESTRGAGTIVRASWHGAK